MPRKSEEQHVETTPHFDGDRESIMNNLAGSGKIGITSSREEFAMEQTPYKFTPKRDHMMDRFEKIMKGQKKE